MSIRAQEEYCYTSLINIFTLFWCPCSPTFDVFSLLVADRIWWFVNQCCSRGSQITSGSLQQVPRGRTLIRSSFFWQWTEVKIVPHKFDLTIALDCECSPPKMRSRDLLDFHHCIILSRYWSDNQRTHPELVQDCFWFGIVPISKDFRYDGLRTPLVHCVARLKDSILFRQCAATECSLLEPIVIAQLTDRYRSSEARYLNYVKNVSSLL